MDTQPVNEHILLKFDSHTDSRGTLTVASLNDRSQLPFEVNRIFWITGVPDRAQRGKHAHRYCWETLVPVHGRFKVRVDDGKGWSVVFDLDNPQKGLVIPPMVWCELFDFSDDAVCLCLASGDYDKEGYISDYNEFLNAVSL